ncbi:MAG: flagellar biosynthetic protein FliO [Bacillota bacterium]|jgi:flagellar biogenesis protein FliO
MGEIWWAFLKLVIALPIVLIITIVVIRRGLKGFQYGNKSGQGMQIVDFLSLNSRTAIYVINIQGIFYLIGCQEGQLVLLDKLESYVASDQGKNVNYEVLFQNKVLQRFTDRLKKGTGWKNEQD